MLKRNIVIGLLTLFSSLSAHAYVSCGDYHTLGHGNTPQCDRVCTASVGTTYCHCAVTTPGSTCMGCTTASDWHCHRSVLSADMSTSLPTETNAATEASINPEEPEDVFYPVPRCDVAGKK